MIGTHANTETTAQHGAHAISLAGECVEFLPQRAAWWGARRTLLVSDLHLGKVEAYASVGLALPEMMHRQLDALRGVIDATSASRVLVLGDLLHAPAGLTEEVLESVRAWREGINCEFCVVPGNHDRQLEKVGRWWGMRVLGERHDEGPFSFVHEPRRVAGRFVLAGHVHPVVKLRGSADVMKLWCFVVEDGCCTLPAFCDFTSGGNVEASSERRVFAIGPGKVFEVTQHAHALSTGRKKPQRNAGAL